MPIYDYQCDQCKTIFEIQASFQEKDDGLKPICPECQSRESHQVLNVGINLNSSSSEKGSSSSTCCGSESGSGCCG